MTSPRDLAKRPDSDPGSLPPPARGGAWLRLSALLALGLGCLASAWFLRGSAAYALHDEGPLDLGSLASAELPASSASGTWIRGRGELEPETVSFQRRGEPGPLLLGRLAQRKDVWVLLPVPDGTPHYVPPRVLEGRLLSRGAMGLRLRPVLELMLARGSAGSDHLLLVGSRPSGEKTDLWLLLLLTTLGLVASIRFAQLALPARGNPEKS